jgi:hypothetical protein
MIKTNLIIEFCCSKASIFNLDKGERKICKDDCVYYLIENGQQIRDRRNKKISNRRDNFEYCIFLINQNQHYR